MTTRGWKSDGGGKKDKATVDADADDFARAMTDVVRRAPDPRGRVRVRPPITAAPKDTSNQIRRATTSASPLDDGFVAPGVDRRELRKLKRGEHVPGSRLDLHGMTGAEAVTRVKRFIDAARHRSRCVCIVHGRGLHSEGSVAILKTRVRECLSQHPAVLAYADAPRADGGSGAVYVLLRK